MSLAKRIFELQQVEQSIQTKRKQLEEIDSGINHNNAYEQAKTALASARDAQRDREKQYKDLDAEAEGLRSAIKQINDKLYGGKVKNPKELMGYEQECGTIKGNLAKKDDVLLELMEQIDAGKAEIKKLEKECKSTQGDWETLKVTLNEQAGAVRDELAVLDKKYEEIFSAVDKATFSTYEGIKARRSQAVVRVEQGRCLGCRITLSISELQRVRGNNIVTCSNCGRILYLS